MLKIVVRCGYIHIFVGCNVVDSDFDIRDYAVQFEDCMDDEVVNFELLGSSKNNDY